MGPPGPPRGGARRRREPIAFPKELLRARRASRRRPSTLAGERRLFDAAAHGARRPEERSCASASPSSGRRSAASRRRASRQGSRRSSSSRRSSRASASCGTRTSCRITRLTALEREATRLEGERGQLIAASPSPRARSPRLELQIIQVDRGAARSEVSKDLREVEAKIGEFVERKVAAEDQLKRIDIRSPQDGTVHQLAAHTVGGVDHRRPSRSC